MDPYATPNERKVGSRRPRIPHTAPGAPDRLTPKERQAAKAAVIAERRSIKKSARRELKKQMLADLE